MTQLLPYCALVVLLYSASWLSWENISQLNTLVTYMLLFLENICEHNAFITYLDLSLENISQHKLCIVRTFEGANPRMYAFASSSSASKPVALIVLKFCGIMHKFSISYAFASASCASKLAALIA